MNSKTKKEFSLSLEELPLPTLIHNGIQLLDWNTAAAKQLGYKHAERPLLSSIRPNKNGHSKNKKGSKSSSLPIIHITKKGEEKYFDVISKSKLANKKKVFIESLVNVDSPKSATGNQHSHSLTDTFSLLKIAVATFVNETDVLVSEELSRLVKRKKWSAKQISLVDFVSELIVPEERDLFFQNIRTNENRKSSTSRTSVQVDVITSEKVIRQMEASILFKERKPLSIIFQDVTELVRLQREREAAVADSITAGRQLKRLLHSITDGVFAMDRRLCVTMANPVFEAIAGLPAEDIIGKPITELFPWLEETELYKKYREAIKTGESFTYESDYSALENRAFEVNGYPSLEGIFVYFKDITLKKLTAERLVELNYELKSFQTAISNASIVSRVDITGQITYVNQNFINISGFTAEELIGQTHRIVNSGYHPKSFWKEMWETVLAGKTWRAEVKNKAKNGSYFWLDTFVMPFHGKDGTVTEFLSIRNDITQRKLQEENILKLNQSLLDFESAIQNSSIVSRADKTGVITYVNKNFEEISGYTSAELIGQNHRIINSSYHPKSFWDEMWKTISSGKTWRAEVRNRAKDGSYYWVDTFIMPFLEHDGSINEFLSIRNDITSRKQSEVSLEKSFTNLSETLIFGKIGSATLLLDSMQLRVSKELFHLLDIKVSEPQEIAFEEFVQTYINPSDHALIQQKVSEGINGSNGVNTIVDLEFEMITATGRRIAIEAKGIFDGVQAYGLLHDVTDRRKAENALTENWQVYRGLFEGNPLPMWIFDVQTLEFVDVNDAAVYKYGYSREEFQSMTMVDLKREEDKQHFFKSVALSNEFTRISHTYHKLKNGKVIDVEAFVHKIYYKGRDCHFCVSLDITDRIASEFELRRSEERFRFLYNNTPALMHSIDRDGNLIRVSDFWLQKLGYTRDEVLGRQLTSFLTDETKEKELTTIMPEFFKTGFVQNIEYDFLTKSGTVIHALLSATAEADENGNFYKSLAVVTDITDRKNLEKEVLKLAAISERTSNAVVLTDLEGNITWVNKGFERISEFQLHEIIGKTPGSFLQGPDTNPSTIERIGLAIKERRGIKEEILNYSKSGRAYWLEIEIMPTHDETGEVNGFMAIESDITQLKQALVEMQRSEQTLQTFMDYAPLVAFVKDREGRYTFFNKMYRDFMSHIKLVSGQTDYDLFDKDFADVCVNRDQHIISTGETLQFEHLVSGKMFIEYKFPLRDAFQNIFAVGGISIDVSEKLEAQKKIIESEARQRQILNSMINGVIVVDNTGLITYANQRAAEILEFDNYNSTGLHYDSTYWTRFDEAGEIIPAENLPLSIVLKSKKSVLNVEYRIAGPKGVMKWLNINGSPLINENEELIGAVASFMDVTERKESQKIVDNYAKRLSLTAETAGLGVWESNIETGELIYDKMMYKLLGIDEGSPVTLDDARKNIYPEDSGKVDNAIQEAIARNENHVEEIIRIQNLKTFDIRTFLIKILIEYDTTGKPTRLLGIDYDITDIQRSRFKLKEVFNELNAILNASTDATFFLDNNFRIRVFNKTAEKAIQKYFGKQVKVGDNILDYSDPQLLESFRENFEKAMNGEVIEVERKLTVNSNLFWSAVRYLPVRDGNNEIIGVSFNATDITKRKQAEELLSLNNIELNEGRRQLQAIGDLQDRFISKSEPSIYFDFALKELLLMTDSKYGFIGEVLYENELPYMKTMAITNIAWNEETRKFYKENAPSGLEFRNLKTLFGHVMTTGKLVISNNPSADSRGGGIPKGHPSLDAFIGVPLYKGEHLIGMVGMANRPDGYNEKVVSSLEPMFETLTNIIEGYRNERARTKAEENLITSLKEKELLIKEIHHRVKNNLQLISSILFLKTHAFTQNDVRKFLAGMREKIKSISLIHERLLQSGMVNTVDSRDYLLNLIADIKVGFERKDFSLSIESDIASVNMVSDVALYCGLIINELMTNSTKYAFEGRKEGTVKIQLSQLPNQLFQLSVSDDGVGIPENVALGTSSTFGMQLLSVFAQQLKAKVSINRNGGTEFNFIFSIE